MGRTIASVVVGGGVAIFAGTQGFDDDTTRNDAGSITESGGLGAFVVQIGDCVSDPGAALVVESFEGVPCSEPHFAQAYATFDITSHSDYPTLSEMQREVMDGCVDRWTAAIGTTYQYDQELDIYSLHPTPESWEVGDREVVCLVTSLDGAPLVGSRLRTS